MNDRKFPSEPVLYLIALILALAVRLAYLGRYTLTDSEAKLALQALDIVRNNHPLLGDQTAYVQLTSLLFFVFGPISSFIARLVPAVLGSLLVLIPFGFRRTIGRTPALIMAFALVLDPGLLSISRQIGSPVLALAGVWLGVSLGGAGLPILAGVLLGLALLGGSSFWLGAISLLAAWLIARQWIRDALDLPASGGQGDGPVQIQPAPVNFKVLGASCVVTILAVGSMFFIYPSGLSGIFESLRSFFTGWVSSTGVSPSMLLVTLLIYQPFALVFGLWGMVRGWRDQNPIDRSLSVAAGLSLFVLLIYPSRQIADLGWVLIPLWGLAAREFSRHLSAARSERLPAAGQALLAIIMGAFTWLNLMNLVNSIGNAQTTGIYGGFIIGAFLLVGMTSVLIAWGWSWRVVRLGLVWGFTGLMVIYLGSAATAAGRYREIIALNPWVPDANLPRADLLMNSIDDFSRWRTGVIDNIDVVVVGVPSPGLRWLLRNYPDVKYSSQLVTSAKPSLVITSKAQEPALAASYRGEELTWYESPDWSIMLFGDYLHWIVYQSSLTSKTTIVLWARSDIFPGGAAGLQQGTTP